MRPQTRAAAAPRVLVINPNTNPAVTERVRRLAALHCEAGARIDVVNPAQGPWSIESADDRAVAARQVLDLVRGRDAADCDAYALACFDDIALDELRELLGRPVMGPCEAGISAARAVSERFLVLTTVEAAVPGIEVLMRRYGAGAAARVRAAGVGVAAAAAPDAATWQRLLDTVAAAVRDDGVQAVLLGSGGLAGHGPRLAQATGLPAVDAVQAAIVAAVTAALEARHGSFEARPAA